MMTRRWGMIVSVATLALMPAACGVARAQLVGYGSSRPVRSASVTGPISRTATGPTGVMVTASRPGRSGRIPGGGSTLPAGLPERRQAPDDDLARAALQRDHLGPGLVRHRRTTHRARRRVHSTRPVAPTTPPFDGDGKILWPSTLTPEDPGARACAGTRRTPCAPSFASRSPPVMPRSGR